MLTKKITMLYQTLSPLTHMMGTSGNEAIINREPVITKYGKRWVPVISGNSIRHSMIRETGTEHLMKLIGLEKFNNIDCANFFYNGGNLTESSITESIDKVKQIYEKLPLMKLLGGSLRNQIITGMMLVGRGTLLCAENQDKIEYILPKEYLEILPETLMSAEVFIGNYQYTRGDVSKDKQGILKTEIREEDKKDKSNLMIYGGQDIISGAYFVNEFILQDVNDVDMGAFFSAIQCWQENNGTLGGQGRVGHGKLKINLLTNFDVQNCIQKYEAHMKSQADIIDFVFGLFPDKEKKANAKS